MAQNFIPEQIDSLLALAEDAADGAQTYAVAIGLVHNTEAQIRTDITALQMTQNALLAARAAKAVATTAKTVADSNTKAFIGSAMGVLKNYLGNSWSAAWEEAGCAGGSVSIPRTMDERFAMLNTMAAYFTAHPAHANVPLNVTVAQAQALYTANSAARDASNQSNTDAGLAIAARDGAQAALRRRLSWLRDELGQLIGDVDPRWYAFGFNAPGDPETPGVPEGLAVTPGGAAGTAYLDWDNARRADRYRVWKLVPPSAVWVAAATVTDSDAMLAGLPQAVSVGVRVTAVNDAGESLPSPAVSFTLSGLTALVIASVVSGPGGGELTLTYDPASGTEAAVRELRWRTQGNTEWNTVPAELPGQVLTGLPSAATIELQTRVEGADGAELLGVVVVAGT